jgi:tetratricopeptide (TPR) repeat protein
MWDDNVLLTENPFYRGLSAAHLRWMFTTLEAGHYHPLTWMSFGLDYRLWGMEPRGYHLTNVLLHAVNAVLVFFLIRVLLRRAARAEPTAADLDAAALVGALFFAIHPLRVESVAWVSERRDLLSGLFYLLALLAYLRAHPPALPPVRAWQAVALTSLALSLLSKAWGMTFPLVLLVLDVYPLRRLGGTGHDRGRVFLEKVPYALLAVAAAVMSAIAQLQVAANLTLAEYGVSARLAQAAYGLFFYVLKTLAPLHLSPAYVLEPGLDPFRLRYLLAAAGVLVISAAAWAVRRRSPSVLAAWVVYAVVVSPVLGFLQTGPQLVADRYTYLATVPFAALVAASFLALYRSDRRWVAVPALGVLLVLAVLAHQQTYVWRDTMSLWEHALRLDPDNFLARAHRGLHYDRRGDDDRALADYSAALMVNPYYTLMYSRRGNLRQRHGDTHGALSDYTAVVRLDPLDVDTLATRGSLRAATGDFEGGTSDLREALRIAPADWVHRGAVEYELARIERSRSAQAGAR